MGVQAREGEPSAACAGFEFDAQAAAPPGSRFFTYSQSAAGRQRPGPQGDRCRFIGAARDSPGPVRPLRQGTWLGPGQSRRAGEHASPASAARRTHRPDDAPAPRALRSDHRVARSAVVAGAIPGGTRLPIRARRGADSQRVVPGKLVSRSGRLDRGSARSAGHAGRGGRQADLRTLGQYPTDLGSAAVEDGRGGIHTVQRRTRKDRRRVAQRRRTAINSPANRRKRSGGVGKASGPGRTPAGCRPGSRSNSQPIAGHSRRIFRGPPSLAARACCGRIAQERAAATPQAAHRDLPQLRRTLPAPRAVPQRTRSTCQGTRRLSWSIGKAAGRREAHPGFRSFGRPGSPARTGAARAGRTRRQARATAQATARIGPTRQERAADLTRRSPATDGPATALRRAR